MTRIIFQPQKKIIKKARDCKTCNNYNQLKISFLFFVPIIHIYEDISMLYLSNT